jgi:geranylgeranyl diphosphate synthase type II
MWRIMGDAVERIGGLLGWKIFRKMNDILLTTTEGQFLDLFWVRNNIVTLSERDYYDMIFKKCAYYTIIGPLQLGALAAGQSSPKIMASLKRLGTPLGYAFQICDDLINLTQESSISGKEQGGDILEGKRTLMLIHLLQHCTRAEQDYIKAIYIKLRKEKTEQEKNYVIRLMNKYGSLDYARKTITAHCRLAKKEFDQFAKQFPNSRAKDSLKAAIDFVGQRAF